MATVPSVLIANSSVPVKDTGELIDYARKNPGKLNFAIGATGSSLHMAGDQFKMMSGADIVNVPYKGTGPALADVLAGQVELMFASTINVLPHLHGGKIKVLGVTSADPMKQFPGVKPIGATLDGFESNACRPLGRRTAAGSHHPAARGRTGRRRIEVLPEPAGSRRGTAADNDAAGVH